MTYNSEVLADSPIAFWKHAEVAGASTLVDSSGNSRDATYSGGRTTGVASLTSDGETACNYNGSTGLATLGSTFSAAIAALGTITVECWIKPDVTPSAISTLMNQDIGNFSGSNIRRFQLRMDSIGRPSFVFWASVGGATQTVTSPTAVVPDGVYHLVGTYDGSVGRLYVNGAQVNSVAIAGAIPTVGPAGQFFIARNSSNTDQWYDGTLSKAAIYSGALSAARILAHYDAGFVPTESRVAGEVVETLLLPTSPERRVAGEVTEALLLPDVRERQVASLVVEVLVPVVTGRSGWGISLR